MKYVVYIGFVLFVLVGCSTNSKKEVVAKEALQMYDPSEMALLMEQMFQENLQLKSAIEQGATLGVFSNDFLNIHKAELTDPEERTDVFEGFSEAFIANQKSIYMVSKGARKEQFNTMVNSCIACHETSCTGPIPKIKKLLIH